MSGFTPKRAMVLAAGEGRRLRPITDSLPKPLVAPGGRSLIERSLDRLEEAGVEQVVVNLFHLGAQIEAQLAARETPAIRYSPEETLLDTGGGVTKALPLLGKEPFFVVNGDSLWLNGCTPALSRLAEAWDDERMDALLLLHPTAYAPTYDGVGDFVLGTEGAVRRRREREVAPFVFTGVQILHPRLFEGAPEGAFSLNWLYDKAAESDRLCGIRHDGEWFEIGTADALDRVEMYLRFAEPLSVHR